MPIIYTPEQATLSKTDPGMSDTYGENGVYKFMGCSIVSLNMTLGFNGTASSVSVTLVEDTENGDNFTEPDIPSIWALSLPRGGVGAPILYTEDTELQPDNFYPTNTPFYFAGICTDFRRIARNVGGKTISVTLVDPREILTGVQCLLSGFALSQEIGAGARYLDVKNVIDVFGYWNYGMESDRNEYGMTWAKIKEPLENVRVTIKDMIFEFTFTGETFIDVPDFYRIEDQIIDIVALSQKVAEDAGSDFITVGRKVNATTMLVEMRGIKRTNFNPLTITELQQFVTARTDIVDNFTLGQEFRNEPNSSIIVGGMRNANYLALPTEYVPEMHLDDNNKEDYAKFPADIKVRLFGGEAQVSVSNVDDEEIEIDTVEFEQETGAIFPFWGFTPDDYAIPLIEPFLPLDHLVFDAESILWGQLEKKIPICKLSEQMFPVRVVEHQDVFLVGDGASDERPFAFLEEWQLSESKPAGYIRGLPLNTECLRAAIVSENAFYSIYSLYYPEIAEALDIPGLDVEALRKHILDSDFLTADLGSFQISELFGKLKSVSEIINDMTGDDNGRVPKGTAWTDIDAKTKSLSILSRMRNIIYSLVRQYALDNMGRKFLVALPKSAIMERIWQDLPVPTRPERPEIEYVVDNFGYWEYVPQEFNGVVGTGGSGSQFTADEEEQIRRRFMGEDGRFSPMAVMDWKPTGNINFNSNGKNKAMFQDLPTTEFRPNRIASGNPSYVFISCSVGQLIKRPDLALVELPSPVSFDPTTPGSLFKDFDANDVLDDELLATKYGVMQYFLYYLSKDESFREIMAESAQVRSKPFMQYCVEVFGAWAKQLSYSKSQFFFDSMSTEFVMDLKGVVIPLTSTWMSYGPYYYTYDEAKGMVDIQVDETLVPWNFDRPPDGDPWYLNLDAAGFERLARTLSDIDYVDLATISVAGFPEYGPASSFGYNSNVTGISVDFSVGSIRTTYNLSTFSARPGTFRKAEYDNVSRARIDTREQLPPITNINIVRDVWAPDERNQFTD